MMFGQGGNSYDITLICMRMIGIILFISYVVFAYLVTHRGDFYHIRRWKAALWFAGFPGIILSALLLFSSITMTVGTATGKDPLEVIALVFSVIFSALSLIGPFLFVVTIGTHQQLKWWLNSDDYLDKIWKDPNKGHKNPIQEL